MPRAHRRLRGATTALAASVVLAVFALVTPASAAGDTPSPPGTPDSTTAPDASEVAAGSGSGSGDMQVWQHYHTVWIAVLAASVYGAIACLQLIKWRREKRFLAAMKEGALDVGNFTKDAAKAAKLNEVVRATGLNKIPGGLNDMSRQVGLSKKKSPRSRPAGAPPTSVKSPLAAATPLTAAYDMQYADDEDEELLEQKPTAMLIPLRQTLASPTRPGFATITPLTVPTAGGSTTGMHGAAVPAYAPVGGATHSLTREDSLTLSSPRSRGGGGLSGSGLGRGGPAMHRISSVSSRSGIKPPSRRMASPPAPLSPSASSDATGFSRRLAENRIPTGDVILDLS